MICYRFNCEQITSSKHARRVDPNRSGKARPMTGSGVARVSFHRRTADNLRRALRRNHPAPNSSASTKVSRVRVTPGQSRLKSAISRFMSSPFIARSSEASLTN
jgi:hypothetical protein